MLLHSPSQTAISLGAGSVLGIEAAAVSIAATGSAAGPVLSPALQLHQGEVIVRTGAAVPLGERCTLVTPVGAIEFRGEIRVLLRPTPTGAVIFTLSCARGQAQLLPPGGSRQPVLVPAGQELTFHVDVQARELSQTGTGGTGAISPQLGLRAVIHPGANRAANMLPAAPARAAALPTGPLTEQQALDWFRRFGGHAVWHEDRTEFAIHSTSAHGPQRQFFEVTRTEWDFRLREIAVLTRPLIDHGVLHDSPLQFTETAEMRAEFYSRHPHLTPGATFVPPGGPRPLPELPPQRASPRTGTPVVIPIHGANFTGTVTITPAGNPPPPPVRPSR
ncbi:MAG: hypothetical protein HZC55_22475 [Verrucomicrobia bacterium]|nr:hypothetical protein [Verrucomicrobiota bacterium]